MHSRLTGAFASNETQTQEKAQGIGQSLKSTSFSRIPTTIKAVGMLQGLFKGSGICATSRYLSWRRDHLRISACNRLCLMLIWGSRIRGVGLGL